jgi:pyruvate dehydrogenase E2 component (dihydrolipoamide acetyltransferase)
VQTAPHFYLRGTADVAALLKLRADFNEAPGVRISVNDLIVKAVAVAHTRVPEMNVVWAESAVRHFESVDLSVAVATVGGLVTPVVRSVERLGIVALATATADLAARARAGTLRQHELDGGAATITNLGMYGTEEFAAILNPPQSAIVAVGAVREAVVVRGGRPRVTTVLTLTASVDHRPLDGVVAAQWMRELIDVLEKPAQLLRDSANS